MKVTIPKSQREGFKLFIALPDDKWVSLFQALKAVEPTITAGALATRISPRVDIEANQLRQIVVMAGSLYLTRDQRGVNSGKFAEAVVEEAIEEGLIDKGDSDAASKLLGRVSQLLSLDHSLGISVKATQLLLRHKNVLLTARIFTDVRPVFTGDENPTPQTAIIFHTLELVTSTDGREMSHYVALDSNDLKKLKMVVDRAIRKEASLKMITKSLPLVEIKEEAEE